MRIYDYVDRDVPVLLRMFEKRMRAYRAIGYSRDVFTRSEGEALAERRIEYDAESLLQSVDAWRFERRVPKESIATLGAEFIARYDAL